MVTKKQLAIIHIAKNKLGMDEEIYRSILSQFKDASGKPIQTSKDLTRPQFVQLMEIFRRLGFQSEVSSASAVKSAKQWTGNRANGKATNHITDAQSNKIWSLWNQVSTAPIEKREQALNTFCNNRLQVANWRWLTVAKAQKLIVILLAMQKQAS